MRLTGSGTCALALAIAACSSGSSTLGSDVDTSKIASYQELVTQVDTAAAGYRTAMMDPSTSMASCASIHDRYDAQVRPLVEQMMQMASDLDAFMTMHGGGGVADLECDATDMMDELDAHARVACSWPALADDRDEATRHVGAMTGYADHAQERCQEMQQGLDGDGWHWGGMMGGCTAGCGMMGGCGSGSDAGVPGDGSSDALAIGKRIFDDGIGADGQPVPRTGHMTGSYGCAMCHGSDGHGRTMMMFVAPDITYANLTDPAGMLEPDGTRGPTYTDALLQRAVTTGIDPDGEALETWMPRWQLGDEDWSDLLAYLKTLP